MDGVLQTEVLGAEGAPRGSCRKTGCYRALDWVLQTEVFGAEGVPRGQLQDDRVLQGL